MKPHFRHNNNMHALYSVFSLRGNPKYLSLMSLCWNQIFGERKGVPKYTISAKFQVFAPGTRMHDTTYYLYF